MLERSYLIKLKDILKCNLFLVILIFSIIISFIRSNYKVNNNVLKEKIIVGTVVSYSLKDKTLSLVVSSKQKIKCKYYDDDIKVPMLLTAIMDFLYNLAVYALQFLLRGRLGLGVYFTRIIVPEIFYTVFLTMIVYRVFHYINYHFMSPTRKESESIWVLK